MSDHDLFISHSSSDAETARALRAELEAAGYTCWMAPDDIVGTDPWAGQILAAIKSSRAMLVLISAQSMQSPHVSREVGLAESRKRPVLPVRIEDVPLEESIEYFLNNVQRLDVFPPPVSAHRERILRRLSTIVPLPGREPVTEAPSTGPGPEPGPTTPSPDADEERPTEAMTNLPGKEPAAPSSEAVAPASEAPPPVVEASIGPGTRIAAFTIVETLGEGGMATVYKATQDEPRRSVALKVIRADHAADPAYRQRFLTEKDTLAALEHQSIVPIYAAGEASGVLYIAMRLVDGPDLATRLTRSGRLTLAETVATLRPIADAVDYAHEMGVVHRDLKPSNIILDRRDRPYLTDFGLGKNLDKPRDLSAPGIALGTLDYMAPEQFSGLVDPAFAGRTDVYALACVAYTCLTGAPPFRADTPERVMYGHLHADAPSVRDARPDLPTSVDTVLRRGLAKNPADRYATADAFIAALAAADTVGTQQTAPIVIPSRRGPRRISAWARANSVLAGTIVTLAALVVVGTGIVAFGPASAPSSPGPQRTETAVVPTGTENPGVTAASSVGPPSPTPPTTPTDPPSPTPPPPTITAPPGPTPDHKAPSGGKVEINNGAIVTTTPTITVKVTTKPTDAAGIAHYVWSTSSTRPTAGIKSYASSFPATVATGTAGSRKIYVWFQDGEDNWSTTPASDTITFDNAPVATTTVTFHPATCDGSHTFDLLATAPFVASDADGVETLHLYRVWSGTGAFPASGDLSTGINAAGTKVSITFSNLAGKGDITVTDSFTVEDEHGVRDSGQFKVAFTGC